MARYSLSIGALAEADLLAIPFPHRRQINQKIMSLRDAPRPEGWVQIGTEGGAAVVMHGYELLYWIDDDALGIEVVAILRAASP